MKKGIIVASFGTTYEATRKLTIEAIEDIVKVKYSDCYFLRAFTSNIIRKRLKARDELYIFDLKEAIDDMKEKGVEKIYIQPLHIINGFEYGKITKAVKNALLEDNTLRIKIGKPLLTSDEDYLDVVEALDLKDIEEEATIFMGHGTNHKSDSSYLRIANIIREQGYHNTFMATVEGSITLEGCIPELKEKNIKKVVLKPFMLVAGDHANNDMASDEDDSWKSILENEGFQVLIDMRSLGENNNIRNMFLEHLEKVM